MPKLTEWLDEEITVCGQCYQASCWQGKFMCDEAQNANTVEMKRRDLVAMEKENVCYMTEHHGSLDVIKSSTVEELRLTVEEFKKKYFGASEDIDIADYMKRIETILEREKKQNG